MRRSVFGDAAQSLFSGAVPAFDLDLRHLTLVAARWAWLAALLSAGGTALFRAAEGGTLAGRDCAVRRSTDRLLLSSIGVASVAWLAWAVQQAAVMADPDSLGALLAAVPWVLGQSKFGWFALAQLALLGLTAASVRLGWGLARTLCAVLALTAVMLQAGHLHAWAMQPGFGPSTGSVALHLMAASGWLGGLLPLRLVVGRTPPDVAAPAVRRFTWRSAGLVLVLAATATVQGSELLGGLGGVFGTAYGWMALVKASLFTVLLGFALHNCFRLAPALAGPSPAPARRALSRSIAAETVAGLAIVLAAATLSALQPGIHAQPVWPFSVLPSLAAVQASPDYAAEAADNALWLLIALALLAAALLARRWRLPAVAVALAAALITAPHFAPLLVPAGATAFFRSPTGFSAIAIADGAGLYLTNCARCHGPVGRGDGPDARGLPIPPADLTADHLWEHSDGDLFGWLSDGIVAPDGTPAMPGFAATLDSDARWDLIDALRARNAGAARVAGLSPHPLPAPELVAECGGGGTHALADFRGRLLVLAFEAAGQEPPRIPVAGGVAVTTIVVPLGNAVEVGGGDCIAADPAVPVAYAIVAGLAPPALAGLALLVDQDGWLRRVLHPGADVAAALVRVATSPRDEVHAMPHSMHHHQTSYVHPEEPMKAVLLAASLLLSPVAARADAPVQIEQAWARATPGAVRSGAVYLTVTDHAGADRITGVSTPVAGIAMIHESTIDNGVTRMRMHDSVALVQHAPVVFKPGGLHIMLEDLKQPLRVGASFPLTLTFEKAAAVTVSVVVLRPGAPGPTAPRGEAPMADMPGMKPAP